MPQTEDLSLAPRNDLSTDDPWFADYKEKLDNHLSNPRVHNILMTGRKGAGKSSIILSYDNHVNKGETFLLISLRSCLNVDSIGTKTTESVQQEVERIILRKILTRCSKEAELAGSQVENISTKPRIPILPLCAFAALFFLFVFYMADPTVFAPLLSILLPRMDPSLHQPVIIIVFVLLIVSLVIFLFRRFRLRLQPKDIKFTIIGKLEAAASVSSDTYCLDKHRTDIMCLLENLSAKFNHVVVIEDLEDLDSLKPGLCALILNHLLPLSNELNCHIAAQNTLANRFSVRRLVRRIKSWVLHRFRFTPLQHPPIRFIYVMDDVTITPDYSAVFPHSIDVMPFVTADNVRTHIETLLLDHGFSVACDAMVDVVEIISPVLMDPRFINKIILHLIDLKKILERNYSDRVTPEIEAKLLAIAFYKFMFPQQYHDACATVGNDRFVIPNDSKPKSLAADKLLRGEYLDSKILGILNSQPFHTHRALKNLIDSGPSDNLKNLMTKLSKDHDEYLHLYLEQPSVFLSKDKPEDVLSIAEYHKIHQSPSFFISLLMCYLNHEFKPLYSLTHVRCSLEAGKQRCTPGSVVIDTTTSGEIYFKNLLLCLSVYSDEEIRAALKPVNCQKLSDRIKTWMDHYTYSSFHLLHRKDPHWNKEWDRCTRVLFVLLDDRWSKLPMKYKLKRFGSKYLFEYYFARKPCND